MTKTGIFVSCDINLFVLKEILKFQDYFFNDQKKINVDFIHCSKK